MGGAEQEPTGVGGFDSWPRDTNRTARRLQGALMGGTVDLRSRSGPLSHDPVSLQLLGGFDLRLADTSVTIPLNVQRVLAVLALRGNCARAVLAGILWPEVTEQRAQGSLRTAVWRLHGVRRDLVHTSVSGIGLDPAVDVDFRRFTNLAMRMVAGAGAPAGPDGLELLWSTPAGGLDRDLLPGWYDDWVIFERDRLRQLRLHAMEALAAQFTVAGRYGQALELTMEAIRLEPLRESAHRLAIEVHLAENNLVEALRHYASYRDLVVAELGVEPSAGLVTLFPEPLRARVRGGGHVPRR